MMKLHHLALIASYWHVAVCAEPAQPPRPIPIKDHEELVFDLRARLSDEGAKTLGRDDTQLRVFKRKSGEQDCAQQTTRVPLETHRVGVVLSGGVSKGLAFVGTLDVLDRIGIRIDRITGTSMGAVVGAFHASGYSPHEFHSLIGRRVTASGDGILENVPWRLLFSDMPNPAHMSLNQQLSWGLGEGTTALPRVYQGGARTGQNLSAMLGKHLLAATAASESCFDNLYVPFSAMATNVTQKDEQSLYAGSLALAVRASLSFPVMLTPTFLNGDRFIDGGMLNNYPIRQVAHADRNEELVKADEAGFDPQASTYPVEPPLRVVLGFDVSDDTVGTLRTPTLVSFLSLFDGIGAISDGIGTTIGRETKKARKGPPACDSTLNGHSGGPKRCLLDTELDLKGGFTDFTPTQIEGFIRQGSQLALDRLCEQFSCPTSDELAREPPDSGAANSAPDLQDPGGLRVAWLRRHFENSTLRNYLRNREITARRVADIADAADLGLRRQQLSSLLAQLHHCEGSLGEVSIDRRHWTRTLEGIELRLVRGKQLEVVAAQGWHASSDQFKHFVRVACRNLEWLLHQLERPLKAGEPTGASMPPPLEGLSSIRVVVRADEARISAVGWTYRTRGLITSHGLTERDTLDNATVHYWNVDRATRDAHVRTLRKDFDEHARLGRLVMRERVNGREALETLALSSRGETPELQEPNHWVRQAHAALGQRSFDVRYCVAQRKPAKGSAPSCDHQTALPNLLETLQERYYTSASVEYVRLAGISQGAIELAEKETHRTSWGSLYVTYHYDYLNKHSFGLKHVYETDKDRWFKPTRVVSSVAVNEPTRRPLPMQSLDVNLLYFPSIDQAKALDLSINPYHGKRHQRIGDEAISFGYTENGVAITLSQRPRRLVGAEIWAPSFFFAMRAREVGDFESTHPDVVKALLRDPDLEEPKRRFVTASLGMRNSWILDDAQFSYVWQLSTHRANGARLFDVFQDAHAEFTLVEQPDSALYGLRLVSGRMNSSATDRRRGAETAPPVDEIYSMGGYFPLAERGVWARRRIDYLGTGLNDLWGTEMRFLEARRSLVRLPQVTYFAPLAKVQLDVVVQYAKIGFRDDPLRRSRTAAGLVFSAYSPPLASLKARLSIAFGGERWDDRRFHSSLDLVF